MVTAIESSSSFQIDLSETMSTATFAAVDITFVGKPFAYSHIIPLKLLYI